MKKIYFLVILVLTFCSILAINVESYAADLDKIINYRVTVDPRMNDATLDITYEITWRVLDSTSEGPLTWVQIGTPNEYFDNPTALSKNIKSIRKYNGTYVRIDFDEAYEAGDEITFKYSIHQNYIHNVSGNQCKYTFTPAWFTDIEVKMLTLRWNADSVIKSDNINKVDNYLIWQKADMKKGEKLTANIVYEKTAFSSLQTYQRTSVNVDNWFGRAIALIMLAGIISALTGGGGYYSHRGFYGRRSFGSSCVRSCACACARSCACACACAGSGRAGCSKKDFYGTKLSIKKINKVLKNKKYIL